MGRLALKYRPQLFEEVAGQKYAKKLLSQLIVNGQSCANLLLHGSVGSGKTSLIRIYAKAMSCDRPSARGEPCLICESCRQIDDGDKRKYAELDAPRFRKFGDFKDEIDSLLDSEVEPGKRRIIFVDEAHVLSLYRDSFDYLLKKVEEPPTGVAFCFATTAIGRISDALQSRTIGVELRPLTHDQSVEFLGPIARTEELTFTPEALSLLAGLGEHQPRNMLQALDHMRLVSDGAEITRERVAQIFGVDYIDHLVDYCEALGAGILRNQAEQFFAWPDFVRKKVRLIQLLLIGIYYQDLSGLKVSIEPVIASIRSQERERILEAFRRRLPNIDLKVFWEDLLNVWPVITSDLSDEALHAIVLRLQVLANRSEPSSRAAIVVERVGVEAVPTTHSKIGLRLTRKGFGKDLGPRDPLYLSRGHVGEIFNAASFLVQEGHRPFNARITIRHRLFGLKAQNEASDHFASFSGALKSRLEVWCGASYRLFVQERSETEGSCGHVITYIPDAVQAARWFNKWQRSKRIAGRESAAITFEIMSAAPRLDTHWKCVRWLCGGSNPGDTISTQLSIEPEYQRIAGDIGHRTRQDGSESLSATARNKAERQYELPLVSAFADEKWERLYDGWELEECEHRRQQKLVRARAVANVQALYPLDGSSRSKENQENELAELRARWLSEESQARSWPFWGCP